MSRAVWNEQRVELDDLLLLGGVVALDRVVPEPQPGGELVVGLDLVRRGGDLFAQLGLGDVPQQRDRAITRPSSRNAL
jgi:hypothetical protein